MDEYMISLANWEKSGGRYTFPNTPPVSNWYLHGFTAKNDYTIDIYHWYGFAFETEIDGEADIEITVGTMQFREGRNQEIIDTFTWRGSVCGSGTVTVTAALTDFDTYSCEESLWKYVRFVEVNRPVKNLRAIRAKTVAATADCYSKPAEAGETVTYSVTLHNCTNQRQAVRLHRTENGWETLQSRMKPDKLVLKPEESAVCTIEVDMNERVAPGGYEQQTIRVVPNGDSAEGVTLTFWTVKHLPHPYICNTEDGWSEIKQKIEKYSWAAKLAEQYRKAADEWEIPPIDTSKPYLYITENAHKCYNAAIVWKLTGERKYAEKAADFLRTVADRETGYPHTLRACHQQMVHEGEFFKSCAFAYDILHDSGVFSEQDHSDIQHTFRMLIERMDWELSGGGISNWSLAMIAGAMYCAMCLQDRAWIERFIYGNGGILHHLRAGVLDDGWWCECTIGYNQMAAGLFSEYTQALLPWGVNLRELWVNASYSGQVQPRIQHIDGLSWDIYGGNTKNYRCIKDLWDSLVAMADYRGVVVGVNDSAESQFAGRSDAGFDSRYDIAYTLYREPVYARFVKQGGEALRDLLHGVGKLPENTESDVYKKSCYFDNAGVAVLRSQAEGRADREQYQGVLKYGSHGGAHGHYDRCAMDALSRYGRNFYNPESIWYSYGTFMYKFYVQNSVTHNMVTTDLKLQEAHEGKNLLFYSGKMMQACAVENVTRWSNPPYGGWRILLNETFEQRTWHEGRYVPIPENPPEYTVRTDFTEPITQRRLMVVTDDYAVNFDYVSGDTEHMYDCIYHVRGLRSVDGAHQTGTSEQLVDDPLSSAQFITDCTWYEADGTVKASFEMDFTEEERKRPGWRAAHRTGFNDPGHLGIDVYYPSAAGTQLVIGGDPEFMLVSKRLTYRVCADGQTMADGRFGAWILGRDSVNIDVTNKDELKLYVKTEKPFVEGDNVTDFEKTLFWGDPYFVLSTGERVYLADIAYQCENVDTGNGIGVDYFGGEVQIQAKTFPYAVPTEPIEPDKEAVITVDMRGLDAVSFHAEIGGDYPLGDGRDRRRLISQRKRAKTAHFISVMELYEKDSMIASVEAIGDSAVRVALRDGRVQEVSVHGLDKGIDDVIIKEIKNDVLVRKETAHSREE